jgi:hypothetical protein
MGDLFVAHLAIGSEAIPVGANAAFARVFHHPGQRRAGHDQHMVARARIDACQRGMHDRSVTDPERALAPGIHIRSLQQPVQRLPLANDRVAQIMLHLVNVLLAVVPELASVDDGGVVSEPDEQLGETVHDHGVAAVDG